jgi:hypothetical protein
MRKARFIEHQIIAVLKSVEDRRTVKGQFGYQKILYVKAVFLTFRL